MSEEKRKEDREDPLTEVLSGRLVRSLRKRAFGELSHGLSLRASDPDQANALFEDAFKLQAQANKIEHLAARYVAVSRELDCWTRLAETPHVFVEYVIKVARGEF